MTALVRAADAELLVSPLGTIQLLADSSATGDALSAHRLSLVEGAMGAGPHHHEVSSETFFVLDGALQLLVVDDVVTLGTGDFAVVPAGLVHAFGAAPGERADVLLLITPGVERFDYFRDLVRAFNGDAPLDRVRESHARYDLFTDDSAVWTTARAVTAPVA